MAKVVLYRAPQDNILRAMNASATSPRARAIAAAEPSVLRAALALFAVYYVGIGLWMAISPHTFYTAIGPFGLQNDHYLRDTATFQIAIGIGLWMAITRPAWRVPMLTVSLAQFALHSVNHLVDIDKAHPNWVGYFDFFALALTAAQLLGLLLVARRAFPETDVKRGA
jgi:hypothetical protein